MNTKSKSKNLLNLTDQNFQEMVINSDKPVLVDFWAPWCRPCLMMGPILEELADEMSEKITIAKLNVDEHTQVAGSLGIQSIPTMAIFINSEVKNVIVGVRQKLEMTKIINNTIK